MNGHHECSDTFDIETVVDKVRRIAGDRLVEIRLSEG